MEIETITATYFKRNLGKILNAVETGAIFIVTHRDKPSHYVFSYALGLELLNLKNSQQ